MTGTPPILSIRNLTTEFVTSDGVGRAVDGVSMDIYAGETLGVVGESGCGKSITALSILQLVPTPPGRIVSGTALLDGKDLLAMDDSTISDVRGCDIAMIFQEPMTSLNPVLSIGYQVAEAYRRHTGASKKDAMSRAVDMLRRVRISEPEKRAREFPHQLSGGMRQRAMIAMALICGPRLLIADEPTTALDVTIQAQVLNLIGDLQRELGTAVMLITHDLGVVAETCQRVIVMYAGRKVEEADVETLFAEPRHPYTRGLLASVPKLGRGGADSSARLEEIPGIVPALTEAREGCSFASRCAHADDHCRKETPTFEQLGNDHWVACHKSGAFS